MSYFVCDVEADGPVPGPIAFSMVSFGIVKATPELNETFYSGILPPISNMWIPEALAVSNVTREQMVKSTVSLNTVMSEAAKWIEFNSINNPVFLSDNNGFDWMFMCYYFHMYNLNRKKPNPFGHSSRRIADMFAGFYRDANYRWKRHRKTKHTHHPVDDAKGNAEALLYLQSQGFKINLI